jgi:excisionase family DNA binding protein
MKTEMEARDIDIIVEAVATRLRPFFTQQQNTEDSIFDVEGLAEYLKVSTKWIYERTAIKAIPHIKADGHLRFKKSAIDKWLDTFKVPAVNAKGMS